MTFQDNSEIFDLLITYDKALFDDLVHEYITWLEEARFGDKHHIATAIEKVIFEIFPHPYHA